MCCAEMAKLERKTVDRSTALEVGDADETLSAIVCASPAHTPPSVAMTGMTLQSATLL